MIILEIVCQDNRRKATTCLTSLWVSVRLSRSTSDSSCGTCSSPLDRYSEYVISE